MCHEGMTHDNDLWDTLMLGARAKYPQRKTRKTAGPKPILQGVYVPTEKKNRRSGTWPLTPVQAVSQLHNKHEKIRKKAHIIRRCFLKCPIPGPIVEEAIQVIFHE